MEPPEPRALRLPFPALQELQELEPQEPLDLPELRASELLGPLELELLGPLELEPLGPLEPLA